jgi:hypothetical protein
MEKVATFCKYKMKKKIDNTLLGNLLEMLRFGQFYLTTSWILPYKYNGMDYLKGHNFY